MPLFRSHCPFLHSFLQEKKTRQNGIDNTSEHMQGAVGITVDQSGEIGHNTSPASKKILVGFTFALHLGLADLDGPRRGRLLQQLQVRQLLQAHSAHNRWNRLSVCLRSTSTISSCIHAQANNTSSRRDASLSQPIVESCSVWRRRQISPR